AVSPIRIKISERTEPKEHSSQSSHDYAIVQETFLETQISKAVSPIRIKISERTEPKEHSSQSSHDYAILEESFLHDAKTFKVTNKIVSPIHIKIRRRKEPMDFSSQSSNEYAIMGETVPNERNIMETCLPSPFHVALVDAQIGEIISTPKTTLNEYNVPGAWLGPNLEEYEQYQLQRWLVCRGLKTDEEESKDILIARINNLRNEKKDHIIDIDVDGGYWYNIENKIASEGTRVQKLHVESNASTNLVPECIGSDNVESEKVVEPPLDDESDNYLMNEFVSAIKNIERPFLIEFPETLVPGAELGPDLSKYNVTQLRRWLLCRGMPVKGKAVVLRQRINKLRELKLDHLIDPKVDGGMWYKMALEKHQKLVVSGEISFPSRNWDTFPSRDIPLSFNFGQIYNYLVETMPEYHELGDLSAISDSSGEDDVVESIADPLDDIESECRQRNKKVRRGLQYVKSGNIRKVEDCREGKYYFIKAQVRASMELKAYNVMVAISQISGSVWKCICDDACPQSTLGRCSHVSALLLYLWSHIRLNGHAGITCTSKPCAWDKGSLRRNPGNTKEKQYTSFKMNIARRATFDPRPSEFQTKEISQDQLNNFLRNLSYKETECLWQKHMDIIYEDFDLSIHNQTIIEIYRQQFYSALKDLCKEEPDEPGPFLFENTEGQSENPMWHSLRSFLATASVARRIAHLTGPQSTMEFLKQHLWNMKSFRTVGMAYGIKHEDDARKAFKTLMQETDSSVDVEVVGLGGNTLYPGIGCSADGIVTSDHENHKLLEIKIPYSRRRKNPEKFKEWPKKWQEQFCLYYDDNNKVALKKNHPYYDQVQLQMGVLEYTQCYLFVWTPKGHAMATVNFDHERWNDLSKALQKFHYEVLVPEYFLMRAPRNLYPFTIP
ncbi:Alkaline nuclease, partial [Frankliniella fusca]